jgi:hypothetical protein
MQLSRFAVASKQTRW